LIFDDIAASVCIKDQLRRDLVIGLLSHSRQTVLDIALQLGFAARISSRIQKVDRRHSR